ncbi:hypothetical protein [Vagococcus fluvialis]|uniref:Uncharacterized protein n=1 Tax=Vagococcus fluvialis TaxID=2738 RepID=A0A7X6DA54_9ENTE|nr:hypothetical protein [Vagococcus fluvialis]NKC68458.1 hypothetical protein [Vagococcus fluvialis]
MKRSIFVVGILFFIFVIFTLSEMNSKVSKSDNTSTSTTFINSKEFNLIGTWYSNDWELYITISNKEENYIFHYSNDNTEKEVVLINKDKENNYLEFETVGHEQRSIITIEKKADNEITYQLSSAEYGVAGATRVVTFIKMGG